MAESGGGTIAALSATQRYPEDYGSHGHVHVVLLRICLRADVIWYATHENDANFIPAAKYAVLHQPH
jgi:hypothetical protein